MEFSYLSIIAFLILVMILGVFGMFFYQTTIKKICSLSISYSSFLVFIILLSYKNNDKLNAILTIMVSILIIFATNLLVAIGISKNIEK